MRLLSRHGRSSFRYLPPASKRANTGQLNRRRQQYRRASSGWTKAIMQPRTLILTGFRVILCAFSEAQTDLVPGTRGGSASVGVSETLRRCPQAARAAASCIASGTSPNMCFVISIVSTDGLPKPNININIDGTARHNGPQHLSSRVRR